MLKTSFKTEYPAGKHWQHLLTLESNQTSDQKHIDNIGKAFQRKGFIVNSPAIRSKRPKAPVCNGTIRRYLTKGILPKVSYQRYLIKGILSKVSY